MKVAFNRQPRRSPWGGGAHFATTFADFLVAQGYEVVYSLQPDLDWIVMLDPRAEEGGFAVGDIMYRKQRVAGVKVLHRVNDTGVTRGGDELDRIILGSNQVVADRTVFISEWVRDHFVLKGFDRANRHNVVIHNGCDERYFYPNQAMGLHSPIRLVTHHWSDNPMKGLNLYAYIDKLLCRQPNLEFTYVGRFPKEYGPIARNFKIVPPLYGQALGDELRKHDVYVTGARWEACGSHHVEGAACGLPVVYSNHGGGVVELCSRYGVGIDRVEEFDEALAAVVSDYRGFCERALAADLSSETMCRKYLEVMK